MNSEPFLVPGWSDFRKELEEHLAMIPDLYVTPEPQWMHTGKLVRHDPEGTPLPGEDHPGPKQTRHIVRAADAFPTGKGSFVADIVIDHLLDAGCDAYKPDRPETREGVAVVSILAGAPQIIRRLLARIDELEKRG